MRKAQAFTFPSQRGLAKGVSTMRGEKKWDSITSISWKESTESTRQQWQPHHTAMSPRVAPSSCTSSCADPGLPTAGRRVRFTPCGSCYRAQWLCVQSDLSTGDFNFGISRTPRQEAPGTLRHGNLLTTQLSGSNPSAQPPGRSKGSIRSTGSTWASKIPECLEHPFTFH